MKKRYMRDLMSNKGRYASIFLITFLLIGFISSFFIAQGSVDHVFHDSWERGNVEDGQLTFSSELTQNQLEQFARHDCDYEKMFYREFEKDKQIFRIFKNRETINKAELFEGRFAKSKGEIALERLYAKNNGYALGDTVKIGGHKFKIVGITALPDYSALICNPSDFMMNNQDFCLGLVSEEQFNAIADGRIVYRYSYTRASDKGSVSSKNDHLKELSSSLTNSGALITSMSIAELNPSISLVSDDMGGDVPMMSILMVLAMLIIALIFAAISKSSVEEEAAVIGTLLATGYSKKEIIGYYIKLPLLITLASCVIGNILAYVVISDIYFDMYYKSYSLFPRITVINPRAFAITTFTPLLLVFLLNYATLARRLKLPIVDFLRENLMHSFSNNASELRGFSFASRVRLRLFRWNISVYAVMLLGVLIGNMMLMYGSSMQPMLENYVDVLDSRMHYTNQYILRAPIEGIPETEFEKVTYARFSSSQKPLKKELGLHIFGITNDNRFFSSYGLKGNEVYISEGTSKRLHAKVGDTISVDNKIKNKKYELKVVGINDYSAGLAVFMAREELNEMIGIPPESYNSILSDKELDLPDEILVSSISADIVKGVGEQLIKLLKEFAVIMTIVSLAIYMVIYYVLTKIVLERSRRQIAYLKIFGYTNAEIRKFYITVSSAVLVVISAISIPVLMLILPRLTTAAMSKFDGYMPIEISPWRYAAVSLCGIAVYFLINLLNLRKIRKIEMNEALKVSAG